MQILTSGSLRHWLVKSGEFPYRPAIVVSVERDVVIRKGRKGMTLAVYPHIMRKEGLAEFPEYMRSRCIPLVDSRTPKVEPEWTLANTYIYYNTCVSLFPWIHILCRLVGGHHCFVQPLRRRNLRPVYWRLKSSPDLTKITEQLQLVCPPLEAGQLIQPENH